jgi:N-acyl-D-amino-acid deacylase
MLLSLAAMGADFDLLIRNARVVDGAGNPWFRSDVGVTGGRIAAGGRLGGRSAARVIDAGGRVLAPGFIDVHTHIEDAVEKVPRGDNFLMDGVTTVVTGNCGGSTPDLKAWFARLEALGLGLNVASLAGHNTVRRTVMGAANRQAGAEEIARMQELVEQAMRDGAVGFSTGLIYTPGIYANTEEVVALARAAGRHGGVYASHMRDEGAQILEAIDEAARAGGEAGMPVELSHFKIDNRRLWGFSEKSLARVEEYRRKGLDIVVDQYPYDRSSTSLSIRLPAWALADGREAMTERLKSAETRARMAAEMRTNLEFLGQPDYGFATVARYRPEPALEGKTIPEVARLKGRAGTLEDQIETIFEITLAGGAQMVYQSMGEADVERIARHPQTAVASDGGVIEFGAGMPHPRSYATNARVLAHFVRERGWLTLEDAVRRMTSLAARTFGFRERGLVGEGMAADLVVFDPARVKDVSTFQQPHQFSAGFDWVIVNGVVAVEDGKLSEARGGRVLRHAAP